MQTLTTNSVVQPNDLLSITFLSLSDRQRNRQTEKQTDRCTDSQADKQTVGQTYSQIDTQTFRPSNRQPIQPNIDSLRREPWLRQTAHDQEVVGSNSGTVYWMDESNAS